MNASPRTGAQPSGNDLDERRRPPECAVASAASPPKPGHRIINRRAALPSDAGGVGRHGERRDVPVPRSSHMAIVPVEARYDQVGITKRRARRAQTGAPSQFR